MPFAYLKDPLFLASVSAYFLNRCLEDLGFGTAFLESYLNDLVCVSFWVPIMLWGLRTLRLRRHDGPPEAFEIAIPVLVWAAAFEIVVPSLPAFRPYATADPGDVLCYCLGGFVSAIFWRRYYRRRAFTPDRDAAPSRSSVTPTRT